MLNFVVARPTGLKFELDRLESDIHFLVRS